MSLRGMSDGMNPFPDKERAVAWEKGANAALAAVEEIGAMGGEYITNIITEAGDVLFGTACPVCGSTEPDCEPDCAAARGEA